MLTDEQIKQFQEIYRKNFGRKISKDDACSMGNQLVQLLKQVYRPVRKEWLKNSEFIIKTRGSPIK